MHSSRMRTVRNSSRLGRRGCVLPGDVCSWGGLSAPGGGGIPACTEADTLPVDRMTDTCKNITFVTSLQTVTTFIVFLPFERSQNTVLLASTQAVYKAAHSTVRVCETRVRKETQGSRPVVAVAVGSLRA